MNNIVILAAGKGTRMKSDLPKVLVPLVGRPMITHLLESIKASGVTQEPIIIASPDNKDVIESACSDFNIRIALQLKQLGTGHAVASAQEKVDEDAEYIIVFYGDHPLIQPDTITQLDSVIKETDGAPIVIMTTIVDDFDGENQNFLSWGRIIREAGKIKQIVEYKDATEEQRNIKEVNPGFYCFKKSWLWENIDKIENNNKQEEFYLTDLIKIAVSQGHDIVDLAVESWQTIGVNSPEELQKAEKIYKERISK